MQTSKKWNNSGREIVSVQATSKTETAIGFWKKFPFSIILILSVLLLVFFDQVLKIWAQGNMAGQGSRVLINGFLGLTYLENTGAAFGLFAGRAWSSLVLTGAKIILIALLCWYYAKLPAEKRFWAVRIPIIFIIAGGLGNLIDRFRIGAVIDMLEFLFINFPIFNLADVFVTTGVIAGAVIVIFFVKDAPYLQ